MEDINKTRNFGSIVCHLNIVVGKYNHFGLKLFPTGRYNVNWLHSIQHHSYIAYMNTHSTDNPKDIHI
jgi:hypothetical protein